MNVVIYFGNIICFWVRASCLPFTDGHNSILSHFWPYQKLTFSVASLEEQQTEASQLSWTALWYKWILFNLGPLFQNAGCLDPILNGSGRSTPKIRFHIQSFHMSIRSCILILSLFITWTTQWKEWGTNCKVHLCWQSLLATSLGLPLSGYSLSDQLPLNLNLGPYAFQAYSVM